jgi:hypothetical protein
MNSLLLRAVAFVVGIFLLTSMEGQVLKSLVYDFDGFDLNQTNLPEGDYSYGDLTYKIKADPLSKNSDMLGDRALELNVAWNNGYAAFGRGISRYIEFNPSQDRFNFYFYNPISNNQNASLEITLADDDNQNNTYESTQDDSWKKSLSIPVSGDWQFFSIPMNVFTDGNSGGNGVMDMAFTQNAGMLLLVEFRFNKLSANLPNASFYIDMINFSEGQLPRGSTDFDLPPKEAGDYCLLGAYKPEPNGNHQLIPVDIESLFPTVPGRKLKYVNTYLQFANNGSTQPHALPGTAIQTLINNGYMPIITWEPYFLGYAPLDPVQPRLTNIINGDYDTYIDLFADKIKTYSDTVIIRFMHEFEGDWYAWCISQNNHDPSKFVQAYQKVVTRFKNKGVTNVLWLWCGNSDYAPYQHWNWMVNAYPGDNYVDIVGTDIYNNIYPGPIPWWRSFRWQATESYYYLSKYFPSKPLFVCELGCRERDPSEPASSETKAGWFARMDKELQSNFHKIRALIFFSSVVAYDWTINTSSASVQSLRDNFWYDDYYFVVPFVPISIQEPEYGKDLIIYPNPSSGNITLKGQTYGGEVYIRILDISGKQIHSQVLRETEGAFTKSIDISYMAEGTYFMECKTLTDRKIQKLIIQQ